MARAFAKEVDVCTGAAFQVVIACAAVQRVVAGAAIQGVIAAQAADRERQCESQSARPVEGAIAGHCVQAVECAGADAAVQ